MKSFKQYLLENPDQEAVFTSGDHVWAIDPDKKDELLIRNGISHKEAFPHLFDGEGEPMGGVRVHGRIGWNRRGQGIISIVTGGGRRFIPSKNRRADENDIYERIRALDLIQAHFPDQTLLIHHAEGVMHTPQEHKKHLMGFLAEGTILRRSFKQYLIEITSWANTSSWVLSRKHGFEVMPKTRDDHPVSFPHIFFPGWAYDASGWNHPEGKAPAQVWGRIDNDNKDIHIVSPLLPGRDGSLYGAGVHSSHVKRDIEARMEAVEHLQKMYPDYRIDSGMLDDSNAKIYHTFDQHIKWLSGKLESLNN